MAKRKALPPEEYKALCRKVHIRDGWRCRNPQCRSRDGLHAHHLKFRSAGGPDTSDNLCTLCSTCHDRVHGKQTPVLKIVSPDGKPKLNADVGLRFITQ